MSYQLVYTSAAKLLDAGRSGFGTVARSKAITPLVASAIERVSQFSNLRGMDRNRKIHVHRRIHVGTHRFHLLSRICDAGADYTGRTHHIAHHLLVPQDEVTRAAARGLTPADVLRRFSWLDRWDGASRFLEPSDDVSLDMFKPEGRNSQRDLWFRVTGHPAHARSLAWDDAPRTGVLLVPGGTDVLALMAEALYELGDQSWSRSFSTSLETTDEMSDIDWVISSPENFAEIKDRCGTRKILDLRQAQSWPTPPEIVQPVTESSSSVPSLTRDSEAPRAPTLGIQVKSSGARHDAVPIRIRMDPPPGMSSTASAPSPPAKRLRNWTLMARIAIVLGLLGVSVWKTLLLKQAEDLPAKATSILGSEQKKINRFMLEAGIPAADASLIESSVGDKMALEWANFINNFLNRIKMNGSNPNLDSFLDSLGDCPRGISPDESIIWLKELIKARKFLDVYTDHYKQDNLSDSLSNVDRVTDALITAANQLPPEALTREVCTKFDGILIRKAIQTKFRINSKDEIAESDLKQLSDLIQGSRFSFSNRPERYEILCEMIRNHFEQFNSATMNEPFSVQANHFKVPDYTGFKLARDYWEQPGMTLSGDDLKKILDSGFVPKDFEIRLEKKRLKP